MTVAPGFMSEAASKAYSIGHGENYRPGDRHGKWVLDDDQWFKRLALAKDSPLVKNSNHAFISNGYIFTRSKGMCDMLDRGLVVR